MSNDWKKWSDLVLLRALRKGFDDQMDDVIDKKKQFDPILKEYQKELEARGWTHEEVTDYIMVPIYRESYHNRKHELIAMAAMKAGAG